MVFCTTGLLYVWYNRTVSSYCAHQMDMMPIVTTDGVSKSHSFYRVCLCHSSVYSVPQYMPPQRKYYLVPTLSLFHFFQIDHLLYLVWFILLLLMLLLFAICGVLNWFHFHLKRFLCFDSARAILFYSFILRMKHKKKQ